MEAVAEEEEEQEEEEQENTVLVYTIARLNYTRDNIKRARKKHYIFRRDFTPAHKTKSAWRLLEADVTEFIAAEDWASESPDLNPLVQRLWNALEEKGTFKLHRNIAALKAKASTPLEVVG
ncbi:hypothetical protein Trydic_g19287 [Trypoxylus dichotomus]